MDAVSEGLVVSELCVVAFAFNRKFFRPEINAEIFVLSLLLLLRLSELSLASWKGLWVELEFVE